MCVRLCKSICERVCACRMCLSECVCKRANAYARMHIGQFVCVCVLFACRYINACMPLPHLRSIQPAVLLQNPGQSAEAGRKGDTVQLSLVLTGHGQSGLQVVPAGGQPDATGQQLHVLCESKRLMIMYMQSHVYLVDVYVRCMLCEYVCIHSYQVNKVVLLYGPSMNKACVCLCYRAFMCKICEPVGMFACVHRWCLILCCV
jgi:hypothetical protein